ncbi:MAG TPA: hydroxyisourate hydrolase [Stellaceae bacterium]|nr:hydroxyisourate hydrolase [Stellaceae bacterium]
MVGKLTTHVLDTARGAAADGMRVEFRRLAPDPTPATAAILDAGGRATLLHAAELSAGSYEIVFFVGDYHRSRGVATGDPPFLDQVPVRFGIGDPHAHYHVPLVMSPFGYSTYRGG